MPAQAEENVGAGSTVPPSGYAFDQPELLADQRLWGIAHAARLLGLACARQVHAAAAEAWVDWQAREAPRILALNATLGRHYFQRVEVPPAAIAAALGLPTDLDLAPAVLTSACATLAATLAQPNYDLARRRATLLKP